MPFLKVPWVIIFFLFCMVILLTGYTDLIYLLLFVLPLLVDLKVPHSLNYCYNSHSGVRPGSKGAFGPSIFCFVFSYNITYFYPDLHLWMNLPAISSKHNYPRASPSF